VGDNLPEHFKALVKSLPVNTKAFLFWPQELTEGQRQNKKPHKKLTSLFLDGYSFLHGLEKS
jgi:hypothetical protein